MQIRLRTTYGGPRGCWVPGSIIDLPPTEARELIKRKYAEEIGKPRLETTRSEEPPETTSAAEEPQKTRAPLRRGRPRTDG